MLNEQLPTYLREIITRLMVSTMRNNTPVINYIRNHSSNKLMENLFNEIESCSDLVLLKRYVIFLEQFLVLRQITSGNLNILYSILNKSSDKQVKWKFIAYCFLFL